MFLFTHTKFATTFKEGSFFMEKIQHLGIASVPIQEWNEVYDEEQAFRNGTIFPELNRPFYVTVLDKEALTAEKNLSHEAAMLMQIQQVGLVVDDLRLYMDTHPEDKEGLKLLKTMLKKKHGLMKQFALQYYPLAEVCMGVVYNENPDSECYCWTEGRIPWEGVCG